MMMMMMMMMKMTTTQKREKNRTSKVEKASRVAPVVFRGAHGPGVPRHRPEAAH
jgi:hypothetical protein